MKTEGTKTIVANRRARFDYSVVETVEAGLALQGSEVKSMRLGMVQMADAYARYDRGEFWLEGVNVAPYSHANGFGAHDPERRRKLLLHREEIERLQARVAQERLALVPLRLYFKDGRVKVELGLGKGRKHEDKRHAIAERDAKREVERALGRDRKQFG